MISDDDLLLDSEHEEDITFEKQSIWSQESAGAVAKALGDCIDEQELAGTRVANEHDERIWVRYKTWCSPVAVEQSC